MLFPDNEMPPDFGGGDFALPYHFPHRFRVQFEIGGSFGDGVGFHFFPSLPLHRFKYRKRCMFDQKFQPPDDFVSSGFGFEQLVVQRRDEEIQAAIPACISYQRKHPEMGILPLCIGDEVRIDFDGDNDVLFVSKHRDATLFEQYGQ